jgi:hypothetical protein
VAWGLNDAGAIAGYYLGPLPTPMGNYFAQHGFVFDGTNWSGFDAPDATGLTFAQAINDAGLVAGYYLDAAGDHGFVYDGTSVSEFDEPDASAGSTQVWGVNDAGTLVGRFSDANGAHGFLATLANAAPEPPEWLLVIAAFAALACFRSCTRATRHTAPGLFA